MISRLEHVLAKEQQQFHSVVDFNTATDKLLHLDFTAANKELTAELIDNTTAFSQYIDKKLAAANAKYGIGGYNEDRVLYKRSKHFDGAASSKVSPFGGDLEGARTIHLGIDIWAAAGTRVYVPSGGTVHSFAFNNNFGDYGATIILQHQLDTVVFYTLYGHLSLKDLTPLQKGKYISRGELLAHFGPPSENGNWPPHLHFQIIEDIRLYEGDYPGVCSVSEREKYLSNCPDADLVLNMMKDA
jgi:murein DD-endopeptidase MepM/ murein hydrolase activator NlpD